MAANASTRTERVPTTDELVEWLNSQAQTPIGGLILFVIVYGGRLMLRDLLDRLPRKKKKRRKASQHG